MKSLARIYEARIAADQGAKSVPRPATVGSCGVPVALVSQEAFTGQRNNIDAAKAKKKKTVLISNSDGKFSVGHARQYDQERRRRRRREETKKKEGGSATGRCRACAARQKRQ